MEKQMNKPMMMALLILTTPFVRAEQKAPPTKLDRTAILRELRDVSLAGMDRRLGPDYAFYHKGQKGNLPDIWMPTAKEDEPGRRWEICVRVGKEEADL